MRLLGTEKQIEIVGEGRKLGAKAKTEPRRVWFLGYCKVYSGNIVILFSVWYRTRKFVSRMKNRALFLFFQRKTRYKTQEYLGSLVLMAPLQIAFELSRRGPQNLQKQVFFPS